MLVDGELIHDGMDMIRYLDRRLQDIARENKVATGIIVSSDVRKELTMACQKTMGMVPNPEETVNRFRNVLLVEDGESTERLEVVCGFEVKRPIESNPFSGLKKV